MYVKLHWIYLHIAKNTKYVCLQTESKDSAIDFTNSDIST